ncbi:hypothetical protein [Elstera cyanobacteriorum]|uniref:hypothetical protein n=1 Tax=Elstera cyanobacteriorum TaxID=2022747 RepID=UPI0023576D5A|nr:hypothetical protein [Elstera cyanobacteriorum]MCK6444642.1 hypothetical protein [Elstera cyanobacteriorum]
MHFLGAAIGGDLNFSGGMFGGKIGISLNFNRSNIAGSVFLGKEFRAESGVFFANAMIGRGVECSGGSFGNVQEGSEFEGISLCFDGAKISGHVLLNEKFSATGAVRLIGAQIGDTLDCSAGNFNNESEYSLIFERARIEGSVYLKDKFETKADIVLSSAEIGVHLDLSGASVLGKIDANNAIIKREFRLVELKKEISNANFQHMKCGSLLDDKESWGENNNINGFTYQSLGQKADFAPKFRIGWLEKQARDEGSYRPQPWRQLQKTLKAMGHDAEARAIGIAHEEFRYANRIVGQLPPKPTLYDKLSAPLTRGLHRIYGALAGYGYKPLKLVLFSVGVWFFCSWVYWFSALAGYLGPTNPIVFQNPKYGYKEKNCIYERQEFCISVPLDNWYWLPSLPAEYTTFSPMAYSLDLILPLVDLGQEKDWGVLVPTPKKVPVEEIFHFSWGHILRLIVWFEILWGWVASLMLVAVISGLVRNTRDDE